MADINDYGMKISRQGFDVKTCSDNQLLWSSSFKLPVVLHEGVHTLNAGIDNIIVQHDLGFYPVSFITVRGLGAPSATDKDDRIFFDQGESDWTASIYITTTQIKYLANEYSSNFPISYHVFAQNLLEDYEAPNVDLSPDVQGSYNTDWGFKVSKDGEDVKTTAFENLQSTSGSSPSGSPTRHQIIHKVAHGTAINGVDFAIPHNLGYKPMFMFYGLQSGVGYFPMQVTYYVQFNPPITVTLNQRFRTWADDTNVYLRQDSASDRDVAVVIFKDPLF